MNKTRGFTIVELIVVIAIIGILTSIVIVVFEGPRAKSRDARRMSDLSQIEKALALYRTENSTFPTTARETINGTDTLMQALVTNGDFLSQVVLDPNYPNLFYEYASDGSSYTLYFTLETNSIGGFSEGANQITR